MQVNINRKYTIEEVAIEVEKCGGKLISEEYINNKTPLVIRCKYDHIFKSTFDQIKNRNVWCRECKSFTVSEEICRNFLETLFQNKFPRFKADWLRNDLGFKLEFDGFCEELNIAFEHQGIQHYKVVKYFGDDRFQRLQYNDLQKVKICQERNIKLIIIPQLYMKTTLLRLNGVIRQELVRNNIPVPHNIELIEVDKIKLSKNEYSQSQLILACKLAEERGGKLLSTEFVSSHDKMLWLCENDHIFETSFTTAKRGHWCKHCFFDTTKVHTSHITYDVLYEMRHEQELSIVDIGKYFVISPQIIRRLLNTFNIETKTPKLPSSINATYDEIYTAYITQNHTIGELCQIFNCSETAIDKCLKLNKIYKHKILEPIDIDMLHNLYANTNATMQEIADQFGWNKSSISKLLKKHNIKKLTDPLLHINNEELLHLYLVENISTKSIADVYGVDQQRIQRLLKQLGVLKPKQTYQFSYEELYQLYIVENKPQKQIAKIYNVGSKTIFAHLKKLGIKQ
jgi:predicted DNA-binding protein YlxM (UPF0122 family)